LQVPRATQGVDVAQPPMLPQALEQHQPLALP